MKRTSMIISTVFGLGFVACTAIGGSHVSAGHWQDAAAAYALAALCVTGAIREAGRDTAPGTYTDDIEDEPETAMARRPQHPGPLRRLHAARTARREMRSRCGCTRYWSTVGAEHDDWCPHGRSKT